MAREQYTLHLKCPNCGREGSAQMSNAKVSKDGDVSPRVNSVTEGFQVVGRKAYCAKCRVFVTE